MSARDTQAAITHRLRWGGHHQAPDSEMSVRGEGNRARLTAGTDMTHYQDGRAKPVMVGTAGRGDSLLGGCGK